MTNLDPQSTSPQEKTRPTVVTTAVAIQFALLALSLLGAVFSLMYTGDMNAAMQADLESQGAPPEVVEQSTGGGGEFGLIVGVVFAIGFAVLAVFNLRGNNPARIVTWVLAGVLVLCNLFVVGGAALLSGVDDAGGVNVAQMLEAGYNAVPGWYAIFSDVSVWLTIVGYLLVAILLALPASNAFFRKTKPQAVLPPEAGQF